MIDLDGVLTMRLFEKTFLMPMAAKKKRKKDNLYSNSTGK